MKNQKLELLRKKLTMFALATSLSVTSLSGCSSIDKKIKEAPIGISIKKEQDFGNNTGLYKNKDGKWQIYFKKNGEYYDFHSHEYLDNTIFPLQVWNENSLAPINIDIGYLPFTVCNPNVGYTSNLVEKLDELDLAAAEAIEKLKNDFFESCLFSAHDIKLLYIEKRFFEKKIGEDDPQEVPDQQIIIGCFVSETEIFNFETWQFENYEGYSIKKEECQFGKEYVLLSDILNYFNEKRNDIEKTTVKTETETSLEETTAEEISSEENDKIQEEVEITSDLNIMNVSEETDTTNEMETHLAETVEAENDKELYNEEKGYEIQSIYTFIHIYKIKIKTNFTSKDLIEVLDFLTKQKDNIRNLEIDVNGNNIANIEKILKEISTNDNITNLTLCGFKHLDLSDIVTMSHLNFLKLSQCTMEDATQLNQFTQLKDLYLSAMINDLNIISNLTQLQGLAIIQSDEMELANIELLTKFDKLVTLYLTNCNIFDISVLCDLRQLRYLNLQGNPIQNLSELRNMKSSPKIYLDNRANLIELRSCLDELNEKGIDIYDVSYDNQHRITNEYLDEEVKFKLRLNK